MEFSYLSHAPDISELELFAFGPNLTGPLQILPASFYLPFRIEQLAYFGHKHAFYQFPTLELIDFIKSQIIGTAIEIGAGGNGVGAALGIPMTDTREQETETMRQIYALSRQPVIKYSAAVEQLSARAAVEKYRPNTVVACWVTQDYRPGLEGHSKAGGVNEIELFEMGVTRYIFVGNKAVHKRKAILFAPGIQKTEIQMPWLISRSSSPQHNVLWIFDKV